MRSADEHGELRGEAEHSTQDGQLSGDVDT
jgi:hypothetical protein